MKPCGSSVTVHIAAAAAAAVCGVWVCVLGGGDRLIQWKSLWCFFRTHSTVSFIIIITYYGEWR